MTALTSALRVPVPRANPVRASQATPTAMWALRSLTAGFSRTRLGSRSSTFVSATLPGRTEGASRRPSSSSTTLAAASAAFSRFCGLLPPLRPSPPPPRPCRQPSRRPARRLCLPSSRGPSRPACSPPSRGSPAFAGRAWARLVDPLPVRSRRCRAAGAPSTGVGVPAVPSRSTTTICPPSPACRCAIAHPIAACRLDCTFSLVPPGPITS